MTLKCKIKEMSVALASAHLHPAEPSIEEFIMAGEGRRAGAAKSGDEGAVDREAALAESSSGHEDNEADREEAEEDQLELKEIGTIEEVTKIRKEEQGRKRREKSRLREKSQRTRDMQSQKQRVEPKWQDRKDYYDEHEQRHRNQRDQ